MKLKLAIVIMGLGLVGQGKALPALFGKSNDKRYVVFVDTDYAALKNDMQALSKAIEDYRMMSNRVVNMLESELNQAVGSKDKEAKTHDRKLAYANLRSALDAVQRRLLSNKLASKVTLVK